MAYVTLVLCAFLLSIDLLAGALGHLSKSVVESILTVTSNPFVSLFIGLLITALIQSSSTTTSMVVALVAAGSLDFERAIPVIIGANIGTTLTSNIVSLSFITKKQEFGRAVSAATLHDFFNIFSACIIFPLQYKYNLLGILAKGFTSIISQVGGGSAQAPAGQEAFENSAVSEVIMSLIGNYYVVLILAVLLLFASIKILSKLIYQMLIGSTRLNFQKLAFDNPFKSFGWGTLLTATMQSSSVTTSLIVPLVATARVSLPRAFTFIAGANIGTTLTALLASVFKSEAAVSIAIAHLMFNLIGLLILLFIPGLNKLPLIVSRWLGDVALKYRIVSIVYIILIFFLLPFAFIYISQ